MTQLTSEREEAGTRHCSGRVWVRRLIIEQTIVCAFFQFWCGPRICRGSGTSGLKDDRPLLPLDEPRAWARTIIEIGESCVLWRAAPLPAERQAAGPRSAARTVAAGWRQRLEARTDAPRWSLMTKMDMIRRAQGG